MCAELGHTSSVDEVLLAAAAKTTDLFEADGALFFLLDGSHLTPAAWTGLQEKPPLKDQGLPAEQFVRQLLPSSTEISCIAAPMEISGRLAGEVVVFSAGKDRERFTAGDSELLKLLANRVATAVDDAGCMQRMRGQQDAIARIAAALAGEVEVSKVAQMAVDLAAVELNADGAIVWQALPGERVLELVAIAGLNPEIASQVQRLSFDAPAIASRAATSREMQVVERLEDAPDAQLLTKPLLLKAGMQSIVSMPLLARGELMGVLNFTRRIPHRWAPGEEAMAGTVADLLAAGIYNARLFEESEQRRLLAEAIIDNSPAAIAVVQGPELRYVMVNAARERMLGVSRDRMLGRTFTETFPDLAGTKVSEAYERVLRSGETVFIPELHYDYGGTVGARDVSLLYAPLRSTDGSIQGVINLMLDITEQVAARRKLEELAADLKAVNEQLVKASARVNRSAQLAGQRAAELEAIIANIADAVFVCDAEGRITLVNRAGLARMPDESEARWPRSLVEYVASTEPRHADGQTLSREELPISRALRGEMAHGLEQVVRDPRTQRDRYLLVSAAPIRDETGELLGAVEIQSDITRLKELDLLKDQFMTVAAHEIKTPVTAIKGFAQALARTPDACAPKYRNALETIVRQSDRIDALVRDFLEVSDMRLGRVRLHPEQFDLASLVARATERAAGTTRRHELVLAARDRVRVDADRTRVEQVLMNLLHNAIRYSPEGGRVEVQVAREGDLAVVSVSDSGLGIPTDRQAQIFERFYRAHIGTPFDYGGLGVGLYISRQIMQLHGGDMWFESEEGEGSTFYFSLPVAKGEDQGPATGA
jgi:two-component system, OmpR family, phosphate regulon sensor histidine kinase PhoR